MIHPDELRQLLAAYYMEPEPEPVFRPKTWDEMFGGKAIPNIGEPRPAPQAASPIGSFNRSGQPLPNPFTGLKLRPFNPPNTAIAYPLPDYQNRPRTEVAYQWDSSPDYGVALMSADGKDKGGEDKGETTTPAPEPAPPPSFRRKSMDEILEGKGTPRGGAASLDPIPEPGSVAAINAEADAKAAKAAATGRVGFGTGFLSDSGAGREHRLATGAPASFQAPIWNRTPVTPPNAPDRFPLSSGVGPIGGGAVTVAEQARQLGEYLNQSNPGGAFREAALARDRANMTHGVTANPTPLAEGFPESFNDFMQDTIGPGDREIIRKIHRGEPLGQPSVQPEGEFARAWNRHWAETGAGKTIRELDQRSQLQQEFPETDMSIFYAKTPDELRGNLDQQLATRQNNLPRVPDLNNAQNWGDKVDYWQYRAGDVTGEGLTNASRLLGRGGAAAGVSADILQRTTKHYLDFLGQGYTPEKAAQDAIKKANEAAVPGMFRFLPDSRSRR